MNNLTTPDAVQPDDTLEVKLAYQTIACRTCDFFWPKNGGAQPYGPYSTFDINGLFSPDPTPATGEPTSFFWANGVTAAPGFPQPEIMDGCRKAPIMTIGINPNLTSFFPGVNDASWCYPAFTSNNGSPTTKFAYYYRYRNIYQEHFDFTPAPPFIEPYIATEGRITAEDDGVVHGVNATGYKPPIEMDVIYTGQPSIPIQLNWNLGEPPYVALLGAGNKFKKGDLLAGRLSVPAGKNANIDRQLVTYYGQFVPVIGYFNKFLQASGINNANIVMGEDVCQLDMVACASPHWTSEFMGSAATENEVISNCLSKNSWVIKQLVQTKPAVLYIVGETSFDMFKDQLGNFISSNRPLPAPVDGAFTLLRATTDASNPLTLNYTYNSGGNSYQLSTRLVISPHFSFYYFFTPQFRFSPADLSSLETNYPDCYRYFKNTQNFTAGQKQPGETYSSFLIKDGQDPATVNQYLKTNYSSAYNFLEANYYDVHLMLSTVLEDLYGSSKLTWEPGENGSPGYLTRGAGSCNFCVNSHWEFPLGCPYKKNLETAPAPGLLELIAADLVTKGKPAAAAVALRSYSEKVFRTPDGKIAL